MGQTPSQIVGEDEGFVDRLPQDVVGIIASFLPANDTATLVVVCHWWYAGVSTSLFAASATAARFPRSSQAVLESALANGQHECSINWRTAYSECARSRYRMITNVAGDEILDEEEKATTSSSIGIVFDRMNFGVFTTLFSRKEFRMVMFGLGCCGKTSLLKLKKFGTLKDVRHTNGFEVETIEFFSGKKYRSATLWDISGLDRVVPLWKHYLNSSSAVIFVINAAADNDYFDDSVRAFKDMLQLKEWEDIGPNCVLVVLANFMDLPAARDLGVIVDALDLHSISKMKWCLQGCSVLQQRGVHAPFHWIAKQVNF